MSSISVANKRGPTVLVTDAREQRQKPPERPNNMFQRQTSRFTVTVDNVLQYASDVPSMQQRYPSERPQIQRTKSGRPAAPRLAGRTVPPHVPGRSTKVSEKLVLLPETAQTEAEIEEKEDYGEDNEYAPERDDEELRRSGRRKGKSYAERLPKSRRADKLARVTAYCTAQSYKLKATATFLRDQHGARTKLYDDCLYAVFHLPLLPGTRGYRIRSSPVLKNPGGKSILDEEMERSERHDYQEGFFGEDEEHFSIRGGEEGESPDAQDRRTSPPRHHDDQYARATSPARRSPDAHTFAEMYIFTYGVAVFWNFTANQEKDVLADLTFFSASAPAASALSLAPLDEADFETEDFHFEYDGAIARPRVFNDMITLRSGDHMIKLAIAHAIAQSTKLSYFERQMAQRTGEAQHVPRRLALTGALGLRRDEVVRILGAMYRSRVDVNLSSNVLDTPNFFWDAEPTLHPLYTAVREYLELGPRVKVLNERCRVFLDLAEILSDSIADTKMSTLTWIIIGLIAVSILVTCSEVFLRFGLLSARAKGSGAAAKCPTMVADLVGGACSCRPWVDVPGKELPWTREAHEL